MEALQLGPRDSNTMPKIEEAQRKFSQHKEKYDRLRGDVAIKLKFLEENKVSWDDYLHSRNPRAVVAASCVLVDNLFFIQMFSLV